MVGEGGNLEEVSVCFGQVGRGGIFIFPASGHKQPGPEATVGSPRLLSRVEVISGDFRKPSNEEAEDGTRKAVSVSCPGPSAGLRGRGVGAGTGRLVPLGWLEGAGREGGGERGARQEQCWHAARSWSRD